VKNLAGYMRNPEKASVFSKQMPARVTAIEKLWEMTGQINIHMETRNG
jgi:hypothetical protein